MKPEQTNIIMKDNKIEVSTKGEQIEKLSKEVSLNSLYDLIRNSIGNSNKRFDILEKDNKEIKQDISNMKADINQLKNDNREIKQDIKIIKQDIKELQKDVRDLQNLPTAKEELKNNRFL